MKVIQLTQQGRMDWIPHSLPELKPGEALVNVEAAGVNRADILQRKGLYLPSPGVTDILGLEVAGAIEKINVQTTDTKFQVGDRVMALVPGGGYATHIKVPVSVLLPVPPNLSWEEAAAIPEALYTSYLNLIAKAQLQNSETVLVHAGAGGIGTTAIQLAHAKNAVVIATAGTDEKAMFCQELGAEQGLNYNSPSFEEQLDAETVDIVFDPVAGERYAQLNLNVLKRNGRWMLIGLLGGLKAQLNLGTMLQKNLSLTGTTLRDQPLYIKEQLTRQIVTEILPLYANEQLKPVVDTVYPMTKVEEAHQYMKDNKVKGKLVVRVRDS